MGFNFATAPNDYALRAQAGLPLDPSLTPDQVSALAAQQLDGAPQGQATPQAQPSGQPAQPNLSALTSIPVSPGEAIMSWLAHGGTPGEAAQNVRAVKLKNLQDAYALQQSQMLMDTLQHATPAQRQAILFNREEYGKSVAKNFEPINAAEGTTETMFGGASQPGGSSSIAPKMMLGPAGQPIALTQNGVVSLGPQLAGKKVADHGLVTDENLGVTGNYATLPTVAGMIYPGIPGYSGGAAAPPTAGGAVLSGFGLPGGNPAAAGAPIAQASAPTPAAPPGKFDALNFIKSFILPHEGGLNPHDMNGAPTKFGINQAANPGVNVPNLTADQATSIYMNKYLPQSGAANLPPALAAVHLDTSIINPARAQQFLQQSGGDPAKYLQLRQAWMDHMVQTNPAAAPYAKAWAQRNADLGKIIAGNGAQGASDQGGASPPAQNGDVATQIGQPIGRSGQALTPQERQAAGIPGTDGRSYMWSPDGKPTPIDPEYDANARSALRTHVLTSDEYKQAQASMAALSAMLANSATMTGPSAYSMLDTFARAINPGAVARPTVIQTIEQNLGLPAQFVGSLESKFGKGNLPPEVRQQIIDAVTPFAQTHWDQAKMLNDSNAELAKAHGITNVGDVTAPLEDRPVRMIATPDGAITEAQALAQARQAIKAGAPRQAVIGRLQGLHIKPAGL